MKITVAWHVLTGNIMTVFANLKPDAEVALTFGILKRFRELIFIGTRLSVLSKLEWAVAEFPKKMSNKHKFFTPAVNDIFSPSTHWEHCLILENDLIDILKYIPIHASMPSENLKVCSPKLADVFVRACFLLEVAFKGISNDRTDRIIKYLKHNRYPWFLNLVNGKKVCGKGCKLDIIDWLTSYEEYCSLSTLEVRVRYSQKISDVWINQMLMNRPFVGMEIENNIVTKTPELWKKYTTVKHKFYSYPKILNLEVTLDALSALISFTAVVPQVRRLLCDHGYIQDNCRNPINIDHFGRRVDGCFQKDEWVNHRKLVLEGREHEDSAPAIACVSNLFVVPITGDYKKVQMWSGLEKS